MAESIARKELIVAGRITPSFPKLKRHQLCFFLNNNPSKIYIGTEKHARIAELEDQEPKVITPDRAEDYYRNCLATARLVKKISYLVDIVELDTSPMYMKRLDDKIRWYEGKTRG